MSLLIVYATGLAIVLLILAVAHTKKAQACRSGMENINIFLGLLILFGLGMLAGQTHQKFGSK